MEKETFNRLHRTSLPSQNTIRRSYVFSVTFTINPILVNVQQLVNDFYLYYELSNDSNDNSNRSHLQSGLLIL